jgi:hypothetical protein
VNRSPARGGFGVFGIGVAACAACCAGPIVGFLAATGLVTVAGVAAFGIAGLLVLVPASLWWFRRRAQMCASPAEPVAVPVELGARQVAVDPAPVLERLEREGVLTPPRHTQRPVASRRRRVKARGSFRTSQVDPELDDEAPGTKMVAQQPFASQHLESHTR